MTRLRGWTAVEYWFYSQRAKGFFSFPNLTELLRDSPAFTRVIRTRFPCPEISGQGATLATDLAVVPTLRMRGVKTPSPHMSSLSLYLNMVFACF